MTNCDQLLLQVMVSMAMSDADIDQSEISGICNIFEELSGSSLSMSEVEKKCAAFDRDEDDAISQLAVHNGTLSKGEKEMIISGAYLVLLADGVIAAQEKNALRKIADAMQMPEIHYQAVLEALEK